MKILSIDVGIKNLAYCLVNYDNEKMFIEEWDVINICGEKNMICKELTKKNTVCLKKATFFKKEKYYCKTHSKNSKFSLPSANIQTLRKKLMNKKRIAIKSLIDFCKNNSLEYIDKNKDDLKEIILNHMKCNYLERVEKINANKLNMVDSGKLLKIHLDKTFKDTHIDKIIIENQIGPLALRMKMMQGMITQHFIENGLDDIELVNASNKLKEFLEKKKTTYSERKKLGIETTRKLLIDNKQLTMWLEYFNKNSKKDDLADSYLQCLWYVKNIIQHN